MAEKKEIDLSDVKLVRGINCNHLESFELKEYLLVNMYTEEKFFKGGYNLNPEKYKKHHNLWKCEIC
jgi:hypothetical protein